MINNTIFILLFIASATGLIFIKEISKTKKPKPKKYLIKYPNGKVIKFDNLELMLGYLIKLKAINELKINNKNKIHSKLN